jgi:hypothetical protein
MEEIPMESSEVLDEVKEDKNLKVGVNNYGLLVLVNIIEAGERKCSAESCVEMGGGFGVE